MYQSPPRYYTRSGEVIYKPEAYAKTGAPMYENKHRGYNVNMKTFIYKLGLEDDKIYIGKTIDPYRRMSEHLSGDGSKVTKKFKPIDGKIIDSCPGFFSDDLEQQYTNYYIKKYGYDNVRGGKYTNSHTLHNSSSKSIDCEIYNSSDNSVDIDHTQCVIGGGIITVIATVIFGFMFSKK